MRNVFIAWLLFGGFCFVMGLFTCKSCRDDCPPATQNDTTSHSDTTEKVLPSDTSNWHTGDIAYWESKNDTPRIEYKYKTLKEYKDVDSAAIIQDVLNQYNSLLSKYTALSNDYNTTRTYNETYYHEDAISRVESEIKGNKLNRQRAILDSMRQKIITTTNTVTVPEKKRNIMYLGGFVQGNKDKIVNGLGAKLMWKFKNDMILEAGYMRTIQDSGFVQVGYNVPIRIGRH